MTEATDDGFHFFEAIVGHAIPDDYLLEIGRGVFIWAQIENTLCALAVSVHGKAWLDSIATLIKKSGLPFRTMFDIVRSKINHAGANQEQIEMFKQLDTLYFQRNQYVHGIWGRVSGPKGSAVGLQQWSKEALENFRHVPLGELVNFRESCVQLLPKVYGMFESLHGAKGITIDDNGTISAVSENPEK